MVSPTMACLCLEGLDIFFEFMLQARVRSGQVGEQKAPTIPACKPPSIDSQDLILYAKERVVQVRSSYRDVSANECKDSERPTTASTFYLPVHLMVCCLHGEDDASPVSSAASLSPSYAFPIIIECGEQTLPSAA